VVPPQGASQGDALLPPPGVALAGGGFLQLHQAKPAWYALHLLAAEAMSPRHQGKATLSGTVMRPGHWTGTPCQCRDDRGPAMWSTHKVDHRVADGNAATLRRFEPGNAP
jgi:hypothetical protein